MPQPLPSDFDWREVARLCMTSRAIDAIEERELYPKKQVHYQFSAGGHELGQVLLGSLLAHPKDAVGAYYRSRPLLLALGLDPEDAFASDMARSGGFSDGRDIGVVCNLPSRGGATVLPMAGDVGSQYTPAAGYAQAILYRRDVLGDASYEGAMVAVLGGEGSVATNGFWSALVMATTLRLPLLFFIEDNGYAISVPASQQTPGGDVARNLASFAHLRIFSGDGVSPDEASAAISDAVALVRAGGGPALIRLTMPRLTGHSGQDTQMYKGEALLAEERRNDPIPALERRLVPAVMEARDWEAMRDDVHRRVREAAGRAECRPDAPVERAQLYVFEERAADGTPLLQRAGGLAPEGHVHQASTDIAEPEPSRINMLTAIRRTLERELEANPKLLVFGEDVGVKGGVHAATLGLQERFGAARVFDTSLSEEGIVGRAVGMALAGLLPVAEIQFRKYADPATEQLHNCGTIRWRTANAFAAPVVVRLPGGFFRVGDPWHSESDEVEWIHAVGWKVAMPSNAEDAVGLLRAALRGNDPVIFFEHRHLLDSGWARRPYPGDTYVLPFGRASVVREGDELTVISWGAMVERCDAAAERSGIRAEIIDLRTLVPWDRDRAMASVRRTRRCLVVHEDTVTAGFGGEVVATITKDAFFSLDAPVERLATPDVPIPYNVPMMDSLIPSVDRIAEEMTRIVEL